MQSKKSSSTGAGARQDTNSVAPFKERVTSSSSSTTTSSSNSKAARPAQQQCLTATAISTAARQPQPSSTTHDSSQHRRRAATFQPLSTVRAVSKVAAAEAAVSAAAAALLPSKTGSARPQKKAHATGSTSKTSQQWQSKPAPSPLANSTRAEATAVCLQVEGIHTGPPPTRRDNSMPGALQAASVEAAAAAAGAGPPSHFVQTFSSTGASSASSGATVLPPAATQLAAYGLSKRIRAQLRSAYGPPPFQSSTALRPRPASPPPVVLDADLIMSCTPDAASPSDIMVADLSSCSISSIAAPNSHPSNQQLSLCSFTNLAALDLSDNRLACFAGLAVLPSLQQLHLSANSLRSLQGLLQPSGAAQHTQLSSAGQAGVSHGSRRSSVSTVTDSHEVQQGSSQAGHQGNDQEGGSQEQTDAATVVSQGDSCMQEDSMGLVVQQPEQQQHDAELLAPVDQQCREQEQGAAERSCSETALSTAQLSCFNSSPSLTLCGFDCLEVLDVSYNLLSGEQILGQDCPLGLLPRLRELHAAGNSLAVLPAQLAAFSALTKLNLQHNQLQLGAVARLCQLPVLLHLDVSHNPLGGPPQCTRAQNADLLAAAPGDARNSTASTDSAAAAGGVFMQLQVLDVSSSRVQQLQHLQELLGCMPELVELRLMHTPLAARCRVLEQELLLPGLEVILHDSSGQQDTAQPSRQALELGQMLTIAEAATPSKVLAAASKAALVSLSHEQLVAAFDRVSAGMDSWQQLAPVIEEAPEELWDRQGEGQSSAGLQGKEEAAAGPADDEPIEDRTFLTGVGIMGELPGEEGGQDAASCHAASDQSACWQDPTERLALALGLQVSQLAHMTGRIPGNPDAALHRLRHALLQPLVDLDAGQRPQQHHMRGTAATAAKQQHGRLAPLPQSISSALATRIEPVQDLGLLLMRMRSRLTAMQDTLLPQLHAQAHKLAPAAKP